MKKVMLPLTLGFLTTILGYGIFALVIESPLYDAVYPLPANDVILSMLYAFLAWGMVLLCDKIVAKHPSDRSKYFSPLFFAGVAVACILTGVLIVIFDSEFGHWGLELTALWYISLLVWVSVGVYFGLFRVVLFFINSSRQKKGKSPLSPKRRIQWLISVPYFAVLFAVLLELI